MLPTIMMVTEACLLNLGEAHQLVTVSSPLSGEVRAA
jgi:hypothetical protein